MDGKEALVERREIKELGRGLYEVPSFTDPRKTYVVDIIERTCTCPAFTYGVRNPCKHIKAVKDYVNRILLKNGILSEA